MAYSRELRKTLKDKLRYENTVTLHKCTSNTCKWALHNSFYRPMSRTLLADLCETIELNTYEDILAQ